jgi:hypothetical protein
MQHVNARTNRFQDFVYPLQGSQNIVFFLSAFVVQRELAVEPP